MALDKFRAAPLPNPPAEWDAQYIRQVIRVLEVYFSQLDSNTPNHAQKYTAEQFMGGDFAGAKVSATEVDATYLSATQAQIKYQDSDAIQTDALISYGHKNGRQISDDIMANRYYGGSFYGDGRHLETPYNQFWSDTDQTTANTYTAYAVTLNQDDYPNGISIVSGSRITFSSNGVYSLTYSLSFTNSTNDTQGIDVWFRYKGTDIPASNSRFTIPPRKSTGSNSYLIAVTPFMLDVVADGDYVEIMWKTSSTAVIMGHLPAVAANPGVTPAIPATPSAIVTVQFVSAQHPPATRVAPLPVFGFGQIGDISVSIT